MRSVAACLFVFVVILIIILSVTSGSKQEETTTPSVITRPEPDHHAKVLERQIEHERDRARSLEQEVKDLQDDLSVTHTIGPDISWHIS